MGMSGKQGSSRQAAPGVRLNLDVVVEVFLHDGVVGAIFFQLLQGSVHVVSQLGVALAHGNAHTVTEFYRFADLFVTFAVKDGLLTHRVINKDRVQTIAFQVRNHVFSGGVTLDGNHAAHVLGYVGVHGGATLHTDVFALHGVHVGYVGVEGVRAEPAARSDVVRLGEQHTLGALRGD